MDRRTGQEGKKQATKERGGKQWRREALWIIMICGYVGHSNYF